jgi:hypothetical protein
VLSLPKGGYAPVIRLESRAAANSAPATNGAAAIAAGVPPAQPVAPAPPVPRAPRFGGWLLGAALAAAAASAVVAWQPWTALPHAKLRVAVLPFTPYPDSTAEAEALRCESPRA